MAKNDNPARRAYMSAMLSSAIFAILGLVLIFFPNRSSTLLGAIVSIGITAYGLFNVLSFLMSHETSTFTLELLIGICAVVFGVFCLLNRTFLMNFLFRVLGVAGIVGSVGSIKRALNMRQMSYVYWWAPAIPAVISLLVAISIVIAPNFYGSMLMVAIGLMLLVESVSDLIGMYRLQKLMSV